MNQWVLTISEYEDGNALQSHVGYRTRAGARRDLQYIISCFEQNLPAVLNADPDRVAVVKPETFKGAVIQKYGAE